jgi:hypothetical protein
MPFVAFVAFAGFVVNLLSASQSYRIESYIIGLILLRKFINNSIGALTYGTAQIA